MTFSILRSRRAAHAVALSLLASAVSCTGSGSTQFVPIEPRNHQDLVATPPAGIGVAGPLDGTWRVIDVEFEDSSTAGSLPFVPASMALDSQVTFANGVSQPLLPVPIDPPPSLVVDIEFFVNETSASNVFVYCEGRRTRNGSPLTAIDRVGLVGGTISADDAMVRLVRETGDNVNGVQSTQWLVTLARVP